MFPIKKCLLPALFACFSFAAHAADISGAGSSAAAPIYTKWAERYAQKSGAKLNYQSVGSSAGIKQIKTRAADFGATDVALSNDELQKEKLICFPSAISGVVQVINLAGFKAGQLQLTGEVLAAIYAHRITHWNDPAILAVNPGATLPKMAIVPVARQDGSGTTYNFTDYLSKMSPAWGGEFGTNYTIKWPSETMQVKGSAAVATAVKQTAGAIGYVDYSYVVQDQLVYAKLKNREGKFVAPGAVGFASALEHSSWKTKASYEEMLIDKPGTSSWPITMGTFVVLPQVASNPEQTIAALKFFTWAFIKGDDIVSDTNFVRLPDRVQARIYKELTRITDKNGKPLQWSML